MKTYDPAVMAEPASSPPIPPGHVPTTTPMDGGGLPPDTVTANSKPVKGYNGSDPS